MRFTVLAVGSQGDVQPYAALAAGLFRAGHSVTLASHETFRALAKRCSVGFAPVAGNPIDIVNGPVGQSWLNSRSSFLKFLRGAGKLARGLLGDLSRDALEAAHGSDALIFSIPLSVSGFTVAETLHIPGIPAALYPLHPTSTFPSIMTPDLSLGAGVNWLSGVAVEQLYWQLIRSLIGAWHREQGIGRMSLLSPFARLDRSGVPFLYGYSPAVVPRPSGWPATRVICGYWFLDGSKEWKPSAELQEFLLKGPAPVYVGFGSMTSEDSAGMTKVILEALDNTGQRAILSTGWGGFRAEDLPDSVLPVSFVPHPWLFPRVSLAIHHGGAGTTAAILQAGVPSIVIPFFADQFFWGRRVRDLGVGAGPIPRRSLTVDRLETHIRTILDDRGIAERSARLASAIKAEDGISAAVAVIQDYFARTTVRSIA